MKITIERHGETYRADCDCLPGSPPAGEGRSPEEAVAVLFARCATFDDGIWLAHLRTALARDPSLVVVNHLERIGASPSPPRDRLP